MIALSYLKAKGHNVKVMSDDSMVRWLAKKLDCEIVGLNNLGEFDLFLCVHGHKIIPKEYLAKGIWVNIHPMLGLYDGHNPIKRYIENGDTEGWVSSHHMVEKVDSGERIYTINFHTGKCNNYADFYNTAFKTYFVCIDNTLEILGI